MHYLELFKVRGFNAAQDQAAVWALQLGGAVASDKQEAAFRLGSILHRSVIADALSPL